ncbi:MAG: hypothetical protein IJQ81_14170 [Oscillibacter sp.]|nr:hypothetical protein [Oscillibacter sp.]
MKKERWEIREIERIPRLLDAPVWEVREETRVIYRVDASPDDSMDAIMTMCSLYAEEYKAKNPKARIRIFRNNEPVPDSMESAKAETAETAESGLLEKLRAYSVRELVTALRAREGVEVYALAPHALKSMPESSPSIMLFVEE